jgi:hypothetical protein
MPKLEWGGNKPEHAHTLSPATLCRREQRLPFFLFFPFVSEVLLYFTLFGALLDLESYRPEPFPALKGPKGAPCSLPLFLACLPKGFLDSPWHFRSFQTLPSLHATLSH